MEFSAKQIAAFIQGEIIGDENATVHTFAKIEEGMPGAISFLSNPKYTPYIYETQSSIVLVNKDFTPEHEIKATLIKVDNAYESLAKLLNLYEMSKPKKQGIDSLAFVAPSAKIGETVYIGAFAYIGENTVIGDNTQIYPHTFVGDGVKIGNSCCTYTIPNPLREFLRIRLKDCNRRGSILVSKSLALSLNFSSSCLVSEIISSSSLFFCSRSFILSLRI